MANRFTQRRAEAKKSIYSDYTLIFVVLFLLAFGLIMIFSTSSYQASLDYGKSTYFFTRQLASTALGLVGMVVISRIPDRVQKDGSVSVAFLCNLRKLQRLPLLFFWQA